jgi:Carboxypeptidase regulatory-like domain
MNRHPSRRLLDARGVNAARTLRALAALVVGTITVLVFAPSALAAETGSIAGTVTLQGGGSNSYIGDVSVCAYTLAEELKGCSNPRLDGEYTIEGLAGGEYKVGFSSTGLGYLDQYYDDKSSLAEAELVPVTVRQTTTSIDAELHTAGKITGRVTNAVTATPIQSIQVCVEPSVVANCERTDANGEYTISELASGEYHLGFTPIGGLDYFFYRQTGVVVTAGQVTSEVDVGLTEGGRVTGRVTSASTDGPIEGAEACAREVSGDEKQCGTTNANGEYTIPRLNGRYTVDFHIPGNSDYLGQFYGGEPPFEDGRLVFSPSQELSVTAPGTVSGIDGVLQPGVFEEPVNTAPPALSGTAVVGDALSCSAGSWRGDPAPTAFTYRWLRDGTSIPGASGSSYTAQSADEGHGVSCKVSATNAAGSQIGTGQAISPSMTIGPGSSTGGSGGANWAASLAGTMTGALGSPLLQAAPLVTLMTSKLVILGGSAPVRVACSQAGCQGWMELAVQVAAKRHAGKAALARMETLVLATGSFSLAEGKDGPVLLHLTSAGRQKLAHARHHPIAVKLILSVKGGKTTVRSVLAV